MKESVGQRFFNIFNNLLMIALSIITVYPIYYVRAASLSDPARLIAHRNLLLMPAGWSLEAYELAFRNPMLLSGYGNTLIIVVGGVCLNLTMTAIGAYFLSRWNAVLVKPAMIFIVFTMFFSGGLIPFYLTVRQFQLDNTLWALIIPTAISTFNLIVMRTAFMQIPVELEESFHMDGATHRTILLRLTLPLSMPVVAVMILFYGVSHWNAWFHAMIFISNRNLYPLQLVLNEILIQNDTNAMLLGVDSFDKGLVDETLKYAIIIIATLPILILYPYLQKYFVKGVMIGALKG